MSTTVYNPSSNPFAGGNSYGSLLNSTELAALTDAERRDYDSLSDDEKRAKASQLRANIQQRDIEKKNKGNNPALIEGGKDKGNGNDHYDPSQGIFGPPNTSQKNVQPPKQGGPQGGGGTGKTDDKDGGDPAEGTKKELSQLEKEAGENGINATELKGVGGDVKASEMDTKESKKTNKMAIAEELVGIALDASGMIMEGVAKGLFIASKAMQALAAALAPIPFVGPALSAAARAVATALDMAGKVIDKVGAGLKAGGKAKKVASAIKKTKAGKKLIEAGKKLKKAGQKINKFRKKMTDKLKLKGGKGEHKGHPEGPHGKGKGENPDEVPPQYGKHEGDKKLDPNESPPSYSKKDPHDPDTPDVPEKKGGWKEKAGNTLDFASNMYDVYSLFDLISGSSNKGGGTEEPEPHKKGSNSGHGAPPPTNSPSFGGFDSQNRPIWTSAGVNYSS